MLGPDQNGNSETNTSHVDNINKDTLYTRVTGTHSPGILPSRISDSIRPILDMVQIIKGGHQKFEHRSKCTLYSVYPGNRYTFTAYLASRISNYIRHILDMVQIIKGGHQIFEHHSKYTLYIRVDGTHSPDIFPSRISLVSLP